MSDPAAISPLTSGPAPPTSPPYVSDNRPQPADNPRPVGPNTGERNGRATPAPPRSGARVVIEWVVILAAALVVAFVVKTFFVQAFKIPSGSMEPTLLPHDRVLVNKLSYDLHSVHRGDIVVFKSPPSEVASDPSVKDLIKRVIGLPGDQIQAINGQVYINGQLLREPYLPPGTVTTDLPLTVVPRGDYYMLGDNRTDSRDSRFIGPIPGHLIVGRAFIRVWPLSRIGLL